jgi:Na+-driven multidrug efflux pump
VEVLGFPRLELVGIGLATTLVRVLTTAVLYRMLRRDDQLTPVLAIDGWRADGRTAWVVRLGIPISLTAGSAAGLISLAAVAVRLFGPIALAALTTIGYWAISLPAMAFLAHLRGPGVWIGLSTGFATIAALLLRRFYKDLPQSI